MSIGLLHLSSPLGDMENISSSTASFLQGIERKLGEKLKEISLGNYQSVDLPIILVKTGGVEGKFKKLYEQLPEPYIILAGNTHNALAASLEILAFLRQRGKKAEIIHGDIEYINIRLKVLARVFQVRKKLTGIRLGVLGEPSDWLIASSMAYELVREVYGIEVLDISMEELFQAIEEEQSPPVAFFKRFSRRSMETETLKEALRIYCGLRRVSRDYDLQGLTVRCFDLLGKYRNTGCLGIALLPGEGIIAGCEGDLSALISMVLLNYLTDKPAFMANPSSIDLDKNQAILAHCTLPLELADNYYLDTHFESGEGVGVRGIIPTGEGTVFRMGADCKGYFLSPVSILENTEESNTCRTQVRVEFLEDVKYFLKEPVGNHHILCPGNHKALVEEFFYWF